MHPDYISGPRLCACGCGQAITPQPHHRFYGTPCYISGHNSLGRQLRVRDRAMELESHTDRSAHPDNCHRFTGNIDAEGYGRIRINGTRYRAHRLAYELAFGSIPEGLVVRHRCPGGGNPWCVNPAHLEVGTDVENVRDRDEAGRTARGERHSSRTRPDARPRGESNTRAKLTAAAVREIRELAATGATTAVLAARYGVSNDAVRRVVTGKLWRHVE